MAYADCFFLVGAVLASTALLVCLFRRTEAHAVVAH